MHKTAGSLNMMLSELAPHLAMAGVASRFSERGISRRTIETLCEAGYTFPEQLLFADRTALRAVKGVGQKAIAEIDAYRSQYKIASGPAAK